MSLKTGFFSQIPLPSVMYLFNYTAYVIFDINDSVNYIYLGQTSKESKNRIKRKWIIRQWSWGRGRRRGGGGFTWRWWWWGTVNRREYVEGWQTECVRFIRGESWQTESGKFIRGRVDRQRVGGSLGGMMIMRYCKQEGAEEGEGLTD